MTENENRYLSILAKQYPTEEDATAEIINLQAILCLPKGTEHYLTDIHGEAEQFRHVLKNGSGTVRCKIDEVLEDSVSTEYKNKLATLIYYPKEKLEIVKQEEADLEAWYMMTLHHLVEVVKSVSSKYTRSKVRKAIPKGFVYVVEELITEKAEVYDKEKYYNEILETIIRIEEADEVIIALCNLIQRMVIDSLHIIGDVYDRGPGPDVIMETLCQYHCVDFVWGNHDVLWMGAAGGHPACIANVIRISARYGNLSVLEEGYGINLMPLASFALQNYMDTDCSCFKLKEDSKGDFFDATELEMKMYKAITILQFKLEGQVVKENPDFHMEEDACYFDKINFTDKTITLRGKTYPLKDCDFPTVDPKNPYVLTEEEHQLLKLLVRNFTHSEKLQKHVKLMYNKGKLFRAYNGNLLFHGCVPLKEDGSFNGMCIDGKELCGREMYEVLESKARKGYFAPKYSEERSNGGDYLWYLWCGPISPTYGRDKMTTFERLFIEDKETHKEKKDPYYSFTDDEEAAVRILKEFGADPVDGHIINGHVPVEMKNGENPIKCNGKILMIDGGFSKAYHDKTGIAGYTLVSNSHGIRLVAHEKFESAQKAILEESDIISDMTMVERFKRRQYVGDTDNGKRIKENIKELEELLKFYREGELEAQGR